MAKFQINTKSSNYVRDKETFLKDLKQFNESKSIPYKVPVVNGIDIDLYLFYALVQQRGGLSKVNHTDAWDSFLRPLRLPHPCINGSTLLRKIYSTYLEKYERTKGPPGRDDDNDGEDDFRRVRSSGGGMPRVTFSGAYITECGRGTTRAGGACERLALSLLSPMPNEQDFAVNVCTVLAADHANRLPLATTPHILDFLLAHAGVYNHPNLRDTIGRSYQEARGMAPDGFWKLRAGGGGARELGDEMRFISPGLETPELMVQALAAQNTLNDCLHLEGDVAADVEKLLDEEVAEDWVMEPSEESQLFAPELPGGAKCVYTQRVLQVASIVRSLSFHEENVQYLARNTTLIRFLLLCANSWVGTLRQSGLDTLGNISTELIIKEPATCLISRHVVSTVQAALASPERARVLAALELLNKLAQNENNEDILLRVIETKVYTDVCALLTLRDIMVLVCTLECVYALTSLGERACECVARAPGLVHTLVSLVTVEAQSYGPRACILMRVVETVSGPNPAHEERQHAPQLHQMQPQGQVTPTKLELRASPLVPSTPPAPVPHSSSSSPSSSSNPAPAASSSSSSSSSTPAPAPISSIQQQHLQQQQLQENEQFALAWLRASYEPLPLSSTAGVDAGDVYRQYAACCAKLARKGLLPPAHFPRLVRTVFGGTVGPNPVTTSTGETQQMYIGIRCRNPQPRTTQPPGPASPILKAQLTNKVAVADVKAPTIQTQAQPQSAGTHPHLSQALETSGATNSSNLIKHLLAHKVSPAPHAVVQVTQRQQNQQRGISQAAASTVVVQPNPNSGMDVDPEALIKCTTITSGGVASSTPIHTDKMIAAPIVQTNAEEVPKEEPVHIQIDEQVQLTIKSSQNKMLADLLEKKSNPPVQVVQMSNNNPQMNAPTIQITETGQIVQVKSDASSVIQINPDAGQMLPQLVQVKPESGQLIQINPELGQIQINPETGQLLPQPGQFVQVKNEQGQILRLKGEFQGQMGQLKQDIPAADTVIIDHSYTEPPVKKMKIDEKREKSPQESVSKTAANLYAALAASALEDEEDLMVPKQEQSDVPQQQPVVMSSGDSAPVLTIQEPIMQVQQPTMQVQQPTMQVQAPTLQVQQPMLQVQPMDVQQVQNIIASQAGQLILQEKQMSNQPTQFVQQPMQIIATPNTSQGGLSYIAQNIQGNMMQSHKTIIIVQGATGGGPITLTVNNPGGLDETTLNSLISQATEAITQQQIIQNSGVIQSGQRVIVSQPTLVTTSHSIVKSALSKNTPQLTASQQPIITTQPQPHKAQLVNQQQIMVTQKQPPLMTTSANQIVTVAGNQQLISGGQQLISGNQIISGGQQLISGNQIISGGQQLISGNQIISGGQQFVAVSGSQQIIMNAPMKQTVHRVVQSTQRSQGQAGAMQADTKPTVIQSNVSSTTKVQQKTQPVVMRQVITRQPVMMGSTKIGEKEVVVQQPVSETVASTSKNKQPPLPKPPITPPQPQPSSSSSQDDTPWICHWRGCGKTFESAACVFKHCASAHVPAAATCEAACQWAECDRVPRRTFALLNHLHDRHCTQEALKTMYLSRRNSASDADGKPVSLGYPPNAAMAALNKHAVDFLNPRELMDENEGPVTKSIRLTAALILRNIVIYSNTGRRQLRSYEPHLASIALSSVEAARTISQVLYDMNHI